MIFVYGTAIFLAFIFLLLLVPLSYTLSFETWKLDIKAGWLWGLISKGQTFSFSKAEDEIGEPVEDEALAELDETLDAWEETMAAGGKERRQRRMGKRGNKGNRDAPFSGSGRGEAFGKRRTGSPREEPSFLPGTALLCLG